MQIIAVDVALKGKRHNSPNRLTLTDKAGDEGSLQASQSKRGGGGHARVGTRRYKVCAGRHREIREVKTCEVRRSHRCGHSVCSVIDLVFVGVQAFGSIQVVTKVLGCFLHRSQLTGVRSGPSKECPLCEGSRFATAVILLLKSVVWLYLQNTRGLFRLKSRFRTFESYHFIIFIVVIIQEMNGTVSVHCFVVPRLIHHVIHQTLQGSTASKIIRGCTCSR